MMNDVDQENMNIHETGKSTRLEKIFTESDSAGRKNITGNSNDWRYNASTTMIKQPPSPYATESSLNPMWQTCKCLRE